MRVEGAAKGKAVTERSLGRWRVHGNSEQITTGSSQRVISQDFPGTGPAQTGADERIFPPLRAEFGIDAEYGQEMVSGVLLAR